MSKRLLAFICAAAVFALLLCGCFAEDDTGKISVYDLKGAMASVTNKFSEMSYASQEDADAENLFKNISDMDYSLVDSFCVYYATNGTGNADEIAIIQVKKSGDLTEARKSLENHLKKRKSLYSTYDKSQLKKLDSARVVTHNSCAALVVADDADMIADAFHNFFSGE